jgi:hypothetical protein
VLAREGGAPSASDEMSSRTARLAVAPRRAWALWLALPLLGAGAAAALLLFVLPGGGEPQVEAATPTPTTPTTPPEPPRPQTVVWNFETDPVGATITVEQAPPDVLAALAPQLADQVTPLRLVVPYDDQARLKVTVTRAGYKPSKRSLIPMNNENFIVVLQPEPPPVPASPVTHFALPTTKKKPTRPPSSPGEPVTAPDTRTDADPELKDEPKFELRPYPVKGGG